LVCGGCCGASWRKDRPVIGVKFIDAKVGVSHDTGDRTNEEVIAAIKKREMEKPAMVDDPTQRGCRIEWSGDDIRPTRTPHRPSTAGILGGQWPDHAMSGIHVDCVGGGTYRIES